MCWALGRLRWGWWGRAGEEGGFIYIFLRGFGRSDFRGERNIAYMKTGERTSIMNVLAEFTGSLLVARQSFLESLCSKSPLQLHQQQPLLSMKQSLFYSRQADPHLIQSYTPSVHERGLLRCQPPIYP